MALKIISGMLLPLAGHRSTGSAVIDLATAEVVGTGGARLSELVVVGSGEYTGVPCRQLSLRHIVFQDSDRSGVIPILFDATRSAFFNIDDELVVEDGKVTALKVNWCAGPGSEARDRKSEIMEISLLIVGETS